jgi:hypothetical protein
MIVQYLGAESSGIAGLETSAIGKNHIESRLANATNTNQIAPGRRVANSEEAK